MSPETTPSVSWRTRAVRRVAGSLGAAVVVSAVVPAVANAAGANVPNPVAVALRASSHGLTSALSTEPTTTTDPCAPAETTPVETTPAVETSAVETTTVETTAVETTAVETTAAPETSAVETTPAVSEEPEPSEAPEPCETEEPEPTESASPEPVEPTEDDGGEHGRIVSTVAHCAPHGKDALLAVDGAPGNHGGFVKAAAQGATLTTPWGTYDLSTQAGADALCAAVDAARAALPPAAPKAHKTHAPKAERPAHAKPAKEHAKHGHGHKPKA